LTQKKHYNSKDELLTALKLKKMNENIAYYNKMKSINNYIKQGIVDADFIPEGTKVRLNYENITSEPDYQKKVKRYRDFIEENKDKIFTVQYDKKYKDTPILVVLKEDESRVKWLFHYEYDLIVVDK
jgi:hypothetical protein